MSTVLLPSFPTAAGIGYLTWGSFHGHARSSKAVQSLEPMNLEQGKETHENSYKEVLTGAGKSTKASCRNPSANYIAAWTLAQFSYCRGGTREDNLKFHNEGGCQTANVAAGQSGSRVSKNDICFCHDM